MSGSGVLNVSLEPHLQQLLASILLITPPALSNELTLYIAKQATSQVPVIPYDILQRVSRWAQTPEGTHALEECAPPLDPRSYAMVSLLAGVRTSPEKRFPPHVTSNPLEERRRAVEERKAMSAVVNGVLSVAGTGVATWWASERTGLGLEWRALVAVVAALVVAFAEIVLYMIWASRRATSPAKKFRRVLLKQAKDGGDTTDAVQVPVHATSTALHDHALRQRITDAKNTDL